MRARLGERLGLGSARAPPPTPRLQPEGARRAGPRPRRLAAAGAEAAAAEPPAAGAATPAPGEEPRAPPQRAREVPARRSGRSRSHPGPASAGLPQPPAWTRSVCPVPTGRLRPGDEGGSPRSSRPAAVGPELELRRDPRKNPPSHASLPLAFLLRGLSRSTQLRKTLGD